MSREKLSAVWAEVTKIEPTKTLYHYTSISSYLAILQSETLWATDIRYLNDAQEIKYFSARILLSLDKVDLGDDQDKEIAQQLRAWIQAFLPVESYRIFAISLSEKGDLLSQWRAYTPDAAGISVGFESQKLSELIGINGYSLIRCSYDQAFADKCAAEVCDALIAEAKSVGPETGEKVHPGQSYYRAFWSLHDLALRIAVTFKHPAFAEESEWRLISPIFERGKDTPVRFRAGKSMIAPFVEFPIRLSPTRGPIRELIIGPTYYPDLASTSATTAASKSKLATSILLTRRSTIPYRSG